MQKYLTALSLIIFLTIPTFTQADLAEPDSTSRIFTYCESPCEYDATLFNKAKRKIASQLKKVERRIGSRLPETVKSLHVHIGLDAICKQLDPRYGTGQIGVGGFVTYVQAPDIVICLNTTLEKAAKGQTVFYHELIHTYFNHSTSLKGEENWEELLVGSIAGWIDRKEIPGFAGAKSMCTVAEFTPDRAKFCKQFDLVFDNIPAFMKRISRARVKGQITNAIIEQELENVSMCSA